MEGNLEHVKEGPVPVWGRIGVGVVVKIVMQLPAAMDRHPDNMGHVGCGNYSMLLSKLWFGWCTT